MTSLIKISPAKTAKKDATAPKAERKHIIVMVKTPNKKVRQRKLIVNVCDTITVDLKPKKMPKVAVKKIITETPEVDKNPTGALKKAAAKMKCVTMRQLLLSFNHCL